MAIARVQSFARLGAMLMVLKKDLIFDWIFLSVKDE